MSRRLQLDPFWTLASVFFRNSSENGAPQRVAPRPRLVERLTPDVARVTPPSGDSTFARRLWLGGPSHRRPTCLTRAKPGSITPALASVRGLAQTPSTDPFETRSRVLGLASPMHPIRPQPLFALHPSNKPKKHSEQPRTKQLLLPSCQRRALELHFAWLSHSALLDVARWNEACCSCCRPHFRRPLAWALAIDHYPTQENRRLAFGGPCKKPCTSLDPLFEACMTSPRSTRPECLFPVKTHGLAPVGWPKWNRRDSDFDPARLHSARPDPVEPDWRR